jgi:hypothetical protein
LWPDLEINPEFVWREWGTIKVLSQDSRPLVRHVNEASPKSRSRVSPLHQGALLHSVFGNSCLLGCDNRCSLIEVFRRSPETSVTFYQNLWSHASCGVLSLNVPGGTEEKTTFRMAVFRTRHLLNTRRNRYCLRGPGRYWVLFWVTWIQCTLLDPISFYALVSEWSLLFWISYKHVCNFHFPNTLGASCRGGSEYLYRSPASRTRRRKGISVPGCINGPSSHWET